MQSVKIYSTDSHISLLGFLMMTALIHLFGNSSELVFLYKKNLPKEASLTRSGN